MKKYPLPLQIHFLFNFLLLTCGVSGAGTHTNVTEVCSHTWLVWVWVFSRFGLTKEPWSEARTISYQIPMAKVGGTCFL